LKKGKLICNETIKIPSGPIQLVVEASKRNAKPLLLRMVERHKTAGIGEWATEAHDVCHRAIFYDDLHDFGRFHEVKVDGFSTSNVAII
jgi:hypothetical protein